MHSIGLEAEKECSLGKVVREGLMEEVIFRVRPVSSEEPVIQRGRGWVSGGVGDNVPGRGNSIERKEFGMLEQQEGGQCGDNV